MCVYMYTDDTVVSWAKHKKVFLWSFYSKQNPLNSIEYFFFFKTAEIGPELPYIYIFNPLGDFIKWV